MLSLLASVTRLPLYSSRTRRDSTSFSEKDRRASGETTPRAEKSGRILRERELELGYSLDGYMEKFGSRLAGTRRHARRFRPPMESRPSLHRTKQVGGRVFPHHHRAE